MVTMEPAIRGRIENTLRRKSLGKLVMSKKEPRMPRPHSIKLLFESEEDTLIIAPNEYKNRLKF